MVKGIICVRDDEEGKKEEKEKKREGLKKGEERRENERGMWNILEDSKKI